MSDKSEVAREHYEGSSTEFDLVGQVRRLLQAFGDAPITPEQLAGFDQFHSGGLKTTADFIELFELKAGMQVLDAGSGLGGPSRYVAKKKGCIVTGVDLTASFVAVAKLLAERTGLTEKVRYEVGNLLSLPFEDERFDVAYTQHVLMNIHDRAKVYSEVYRVLKPSGKFGFFDVLAADDKAMPLYPVPWAEQVQNSVLLTEAETRAAMNAAGLKLDVWKDVTQEIIDWFTNVQLPAMLGGNQGPSLKLVMGERFELMAENFSKNLRQHKMRLVMATAVRD
jgi:ubiquinone/menaquinone biosynthesis C-methylase UbiE